MRYVFGALTRDILSV